MDAGGQVRTFLLSGIREARLTDEPFVPPEDLARLLEENRRTHLVRVELPQSARWAADMYAESVTEVEDRETTVVLDVALLPPVRHRLGVLLLASGRPAGVLDPVDLDSCGVELARTLLEHHRSPADA